MLHRHLKTHQPAKLRGDSPGCPNDLTVGLSKPRPKKQVEMPVRDVCAKTFATQKTLKRRRETVHRQSGSISGPVCDQRFYRGDHLKKHHIRKHAHEEYEQLCQESQVYHQTNHGLV